MAMPPNMGRPGAGPSFLGGGASNANSLQSRLSGGAPSMPFQSRSMPPPTGANGIASAFQGVNPARAGYDVGNAAIMAQQNRAMPSQQMAGLRPMGQPQEFGQIPQAADQNAAPTQYSSPPPQLTSSQRARQAQQQQLQAPYLDLQNSIKNSPAEQYRSTASYLGGNMPDQFAPLDAYRQQQYNAEQAFRNQYASAAPGDLAELSRTYQNQQLTAGQQFEAQNPGLMSKYQQAVQNQAQQAMPQNQTGQQGQTGLNAQASQFMQQLMQQGQGGMGGQQLSAPNAGQQYGMQQGQMGQLGGMGGAPMQYPLGGPQGQGGFLGALQPAGGLQSGLTGLGGGAPMPGAQGFGPFGAQPMPQQNNSGTTFNPNAVYSMSPNSLALGVAASEGRIPASMASTPPTQPQPSASTMSAINRANGGNMPAFAMGAPGGFGGFGGR